MFLISIFKDFPGPHFNFITIPKDLLFCFFDWARAHAKVQHSVTTLGLPLPANANHQVAPVLVAFIHSRQLNDIAKFGAFRNE